MDNPETSIKGDANIIGDHNLAINQQFINALPNFLAQLEETPPRQHTRLLLDRLSVLLITAFVLFCLAAVTGPLLLFEYSGRSLLAEDIQDLIVASSSAMSGLTALVGVLLGYHIRDRRRSQE